jgi:hypothetical protein
MWITSGIGMGSRGQVRLPIAHFRLPIEGGGDTRGQKEALFEKCHLAGRWDCRLPISDWLLGEEGTLGDRRGHIFRWEALPVGAGC